MLFQYMFSTKNSWISLAMALRLAGSISRA